jgi:hypothetical protein
MVRGILSLLLLTLAGYSSALPPTRPPTPPAGARPVLAALCAAFRAALLWLAFDHRLRTSTKGASGNVRRGQPN